jgi:hypothetical protein
MVDHNEIDAELQQAVQAIASQLQLLHAGAAELLLGTVTLAENIDPREIDVAAFGITRTLHNARDFAWAPEQLSTSGFGVDDLQNLICFVEGLPALGGQGDNVPKENLRLVRYAADARANILGLEIGPEAGDFESFEGFLTVPHIAALAQLGERSVRNAVSRGELRANGRANEEPTFPASSVYPWLLNRRSFVPWPDTHAGRRRLVTQALDAQTRARFASVAAQLANSVPRDRLPVGSEQVFDGSYGPDVALLSALAETLDLPDSPAFVGHAITLALREQVA